DPGPDDEQHEQQVQEVLDAQPQREPGVDRRSEAPRPRMLGDPALYPRIGTQLLAQRDREDQPHDDDREQPGGAVPAFAEAHLWDPRPDRGDPSCPLGADDAILGGAELGLERIRGAERVPRRCHAGRRARSARAAVARWGLRLTHADLLALRLVTSVTT